MIIQLKENRTKGAQKELESTLEQFDIQFYPVNTQLKSYLVGLLKKELDLRHIGAMEAVEDVHRVFGKHKLVSADWKRTGSSIAVNDLEIGNGKAIMMAGPCSIESEEQVDLIASYLKEQGIPIMRGGAFKPRTSPYSFRGLGLEGLKMFHSICKSKGIKVITEVMESSQIEHMYPYVDIFQVGARNSQNFNLLEALGKVDKPVLIKRGISGSIDELLYSAEYVFHKGNERIILCERGIRSFESAYRNTLDLNAVPILKEKSHLPVIVDPSHGIGIRKHVPKMSLAGLAAGADGLIVEIHEEPERAFTDGQQSLSLNEFSLLNQKVQQIQDLNLF